jgi:putative transposase
LRRKPPGHHDICHLDEVVITIAGKKHSLWRAVDQDGYARDKIVQTRRNTKAAKRLLTRLLRKQGVAPKRIIAEKLRSYGAARRQVMPQVERPAARGPQQPSGEFACAAAKTGTNNAGLPIGRP